MMDRGCSWSQIPHRGSGIGVAAGRGHRQPLQRQFLQGRSRFVPSGVCWTRCPLRPGSSTPSRGDTPQGRALGWQLLQDLGVRCPCKATSHSLPILAWGCTHFATPTPRSLRVLPALLLPAHTPRLHARMKTKCKYYCWQRLPAPPLRFRHL